MVSGSGYYNKPIKRVPNDNVNYAQCYQKLLKDSAVSQNTDV